LYLYAEFYRNVEDETFHVSLLFLEEYFIRKEMSRLVTTYSIILNLIMYKYKI